MINYHNLLEEILVDGTDFKNERTNDVCRTIPFSSLTYDLSNGFPLLSSRKMAIKGLVGELLGFFRGVTNSNDFKALGCNFWEKNANETKSWLDNPFRKGEGDLGDIYSKIWTEHVSYKLIKYINENGDISEEATIQADYLVANGYRMAASCSRGKTWLYTKTTNQLEEVVRKILTDPSDRRIVLSGWDLGSMVSQALPVCHTLYKFIVQPTTGKIHMSMSQRSTDAYLGLPMNIASCALLLEIVCRLTGYTAGKIKLDVNDVHLYSNQISAARELITRPCYDLPKLVLSDRIKKVDLDSVKGCFSSIEPSDISVENYVHEEALTVPMMA